MTSYLLVLPALAGIAFLVVIHELGHLLVARAFGIRVTVFSIGFGARLFGVNWKGTDYRVSSFPFGGYVRMSHADPFGDAGYEDEERDDTPRSEWFSLRPAWQRLCVMFGGPASNLLFPFGLFTLLMVAGEPQPRAEVGTVLTGSLAEKSGLLPGDRIVAVEGTPVATWLDVLDALHDAPSASIRLSVERGSGAANVQLDAPADAPRSLDTYGMDSLAPDTSVGVDAPQSPVGKAGLVTGDRIRSVDGVAVRDFNALTEALAAAGDTVNLGLLRATGEIVDVPVQADPTWSPEVSAADDAAWRRWGVASQNCFVAELLEGSAAAEAGLRAGDRLLSVDGRTIRGFQDVVVAVADSGSGEGDEKVARPLTVVVRRGGNVETRTVTPIVTQTTTAGLYVWKPQVGIRGGGGMTEQEQIPRPYPVTEAFPRAVAETSSVVSYIVERIGQMVTMEAPVLDNLGGPVAMVAQAKQAAEIGPFALGRMIAAFSISLGVLNLLPIPVLDGGNIFMYGAEWLRGRPLPLALRERAQQVGVIFLVLLSLVVFAKDSFRAITSFLLPPR